VLKARRAVDTSAWRWWRRKSFVKALSGSLVGQMVLDASQTECHRMIDGVTVMSALQLGFPAAVSARGLQSKLRLTRLVLVGLRPVAGRSRRVSACALARLAPCVL